MQNSRETPSQFFKHCTHKPIFVYVKSVAEITVPVKVTKAALRYGIKRAVNVTEIRYTETERGYFITLIN